MAQPTQFPNRLSLSLRPVFIKAFELLSATNPNLAEETRLTLAETLVNAHGHNLDAYRLNFQLTGYGDRIKNTTPYNYYLKDAPMTGNIMETLNHAVYFEHGGNTSKVVAVDAPERLVLTESGSVYSLGAQIAVTKVGTVIAPAAWPFPVKRAEPARFISAEDYASDEDLARKYVEHQRRDDARTFTQTLVWKSYDDDCRFRFSLYADVYGKRVVHDMAGDVMSTDGAWGELFYTEDGVTENMRFSTYYCFVAYMLAKYW